MKKFIVLYHAPAEAQMESAKLTPEQQAAGMQAWMTWAQRCGDKLLDLGQPLVNGQALTPSGSSASTKQVAGYSVLQAGDMSEAITLLQGHPHLAWNAGCSIELHEAMPIPGM